MSQNCFDRNQKSHRDAGTGALLGVIYLTQYKLIVHIFWNKK